MIPNFLLMRWLGWVDTYRALIIPAAFSAFGTFLLRQFFLSIPPELEEAARVDGCSYFGDLPAHHPAALRAGPGDAGRLRVHDPVERLPLAADRHHTETMRTLTVGHPLLRGRGGRRSTTT